MSRTWLFIAAVSCFAGAVAAVADDFAVKVTVREPVGVERQAEPASGGIPFKKGQVNMASAGAGSQSHLSGAYFMQAGHFESLHVPYKGGGASVASVIAGESHWTLTPAPAVMSYVNSGRLRAIAHSLPKPSPLLPNIPPIADTVRGFDYSGWQGFFVPKGTPKAIIEKLRAAVIKTVNLPEVKKGLAAQGTEIVTGTPEEFRKVVQDSMVKNARVVKAVGLTMN